MVRSKVMFTLQQNTFVNSVQQTEPSVMSSSSKATLPDTGDHKTDLSQLGVLAMIGSFLVEIAGYFKKRKD